jgi:hypothetical protein
MDDRELRATVARIDERTASILNNQEKLGKALKSHEDQDHVDFKEVHDRITKVDRKQNWMLGVATAVVAIFIGTVKGMFGG